MKLRPLGDRVVLKRGEVEEKTASGLFIAGANKEQPQYAEVVAVGPGALVDGKRVPMEVKEGLLRQVRRQRDQARRSGIHSYRTVGHHGCHRVRGQ